MKAFLSVVSWIMEWPGKHLYIIKPAKKAGEQALLCLLTLGGIAAIMAAIIIMYTVLGVHD